LFRELAAIQPGFWLARAIDKETYVDGQLEVRTHLTVSELEFDDVPDSLFSLEFEPGTGISDLRHFERRADGSLQIVSYTIPANPGDLDAIVAAAVAAENEYEKQANRGQMVRWWLLAGNMVVVLIALGWLWARGRKKQA
jgi:hypothetical protein